MPASRITVQFQGSLEDEWHVTLSAFLSQLEAIKAALKQTERLVSGEDEPSVYYRIVGLSYSSPATVVLEAVSRVTQPQQEPKKKARRVQRVDYSQATVRQFFHSLKGIRERKQVPARADLQALEAYRNLAGPLEKKVSGLKLIDSEETKESVDIDRTFQSAIDEIIGPDELVEGTINGTLEKLNLHNATRFDIFPPIGPKQVACDFKPSLKPDVIRAVDQYVSVGGKLRYKRLENFPYAIDAESIEILPPENELPSLFDIKGMAPDLTRGKTTAEFLEGIRDAESE
jgi:hypothetical protein